MDPEARHGLCGYCVAGYYLNIFNGIHVRGGFVMEHGKNTAELGRRIRGRIREAGREDLEVFFDHGRRGESKRPVPYFDHYDASTSLAFVDIAVISKGTNRVLVLCEVEEEGANPKKIIGDCFNIFLSDFVRIERRPYDFKGAHLILGVRVHEKGKAARKISSLEKRIPACIKEEALKGIKLQLVPEPDRDILLDRLEDRICEIAGI